MPDDVRIPVPTGRVQLPQSYSNRQTRMGANPRHLIIAAGAVGGLLVAGVGGWALLNRRPAVVPVIQADTRPLRVKPDNPGGMQVAGADELVMGGHGAGGEGAMAPAPEAPAPQALRAQLQQPAAAVPAPSAPTSVPGPVPPGTSPLPDTPPRAAAPPRPAASAAAPPRAATGGAMVQLAALDSEQAAQGEWQRLAKKMPDLLGDRRPVVQKADRDGKTVFRVRVGGFSDIADATGFCTRVRAKGGNCTIAS